MKLNIDLAKLSVAISEKLNQRVEIVSAELVGSGFHSDGYRLTAADGRQFFLKRIKAQGMGFEFPERKIAAMLVSESMGRRAATSPKPLGIMLGDGSELLNLPEIGEQTEVYQLQEFESAGTDYWSRLQQCVDKKAVDETDHAELTRVVDIIAQIHSVKHESQDAEKLKHVYNDGLRAMLIHPELTLHTLSTFPKNHPIWTMDRQKDFLGLMLENIYAMQDRSDRLRALHGDFWGANLFFRPDGSAYIIDYSRIPWGEPGIDIGWWFSQYFMFYIRTNNPYFKELGELFLKMYSEKTKDEEIRTKLGLSLAFVCLVYTSPVFYPNLDLEFGLRLTEAARKILQTKQLIWND